MQKAVAGAFASIWMALCLIPAAGLQITSAFAEDGVVLHLGKDSPALHIPVGNQDVFAEPAFEDYMYMFFDLCDAMGLDVKDQCNIYPMNASLGGNAIATVQDGNRIIAYRRDWKRSIWIKIDPVVAAPLLSVALPFCSDGGRETGIGTGSCHTSRALMSGTCQFPQSPPFTRLEKAIRTGSGWCRDPRPTAVRMTSGQC